MNDRKSIVAPSGYRNVYDDNNRDSYSVPENECSALSVGNVIKYYYLQKLDITISEFARRCDLSRKHIYSILSDKSELTPSSAKKIADALGADALVLLNIQARYRLGLLGKNGDSNG